MAKRAVKKRRTARVFYEEALSRQVDLDRIIVMIPSSIMVRVVDEFKQLTLFFERLVKDTE